MKNSLNALTIFGKELPWNLDTALFWLLVAQVALIMFMVIVFAVLLRRVGRRNENATIVIREPEEEGKPDEVPEKEAIEEPKVEFPEELRGIWGIEGHDGIRVVIGTSTLSVDGVVATGIAATETEGEYAFLLGDAEFTVFLKRARKHGETSDGDAEVPAEVAAAETPETIGEAADADEDDGNLRLINGGDYAYCKLCKWVKETAPEAEAEPLVITFPGSLRGDWVVEGHESVHVRIEEHTLFIDGIEATDIALNAEKPTEYMCKVNGLDYVVAYDTSDEGGFRNISGGEFKACALVEPFEAEAEPEPVEETPAEEPAEEPVEEEIVEAPAEEPAEEPAEAPAEETAEEAIVEEPAVEPEPEIKHEEPVSIVPDRGEEVSHEGGVLRYEKSFTARYIQSSDEIKDWYIKLKNEMLSYKKVKARMSWKRETFRYGRETVARLAYRGNTMCIFLPLDPAAYEDSKYKVEDVSDSPSYVDTPCMYRLKNEKRVRLAIELYATVMERLGAVHIERIAEDYYLPYEGIVELIDKGLARRVIKSKSDEAIFTQVAPVEEAAAEKEPEPEAKHEPEVEHESEVEHEPEPEVKPEPEPEPEAEHKPELLVSDYGEEESYAGGVLRYDKSFTAKLIQSEDEVKGWYTDIKNELLSYKRVHARMSWKRESYNFGREAFAKMSFRGNTLCLYLPIDPNSLEDSKYKVENVEENASYADTPCLYRIKNFKRVKYAKELIAFVAGFVQIEKSERDSVDYYLPYEGLVELINKGLIKRNIKDRNEEAFFDDRKAEPSTAEQEGVEPSEEQPADEVAATEVVSEEEPTEEPAVENTEIEELSPQELEYIRSYEEEAEDEDGIEVIGVMFRRRGRKVYWFDPDGKTWEKGEIAFYITPDNPPQEVIVVDNAKLSPSKLHLPLKPLHKARRPQTPNK